METFARAGALSGYFQVARRHGFNPQALLRQVGLDAATLANPEQRIPVSAGCQLLEASARETKCPTFGLQMAELRQDFDFGVVGMLLAHKRTLREVLLASIQYRHLLNEALGLHIETAAGKVIIREEVVSELDVPTRQATELAVGLLARTCNALLGQGWKPVSVHFAHAAPPDVRPYRRFFGCPVSFNSDFNGIVCAASDLDQPNPNADPELVKYAESLARPLDASRPESMTDEVRKAIYLLLPLEQASVDQVASHLHLSARTLRRRLETAGTSFSDLLEEVRHNLAIRYLNNSRYPIGGVATLLGYARQASFTRWFTSGFGMTPRAWRTRQIEGVAHTAKSAAIETPLQ
ncbi:AraC family transcriptional regulator [Paraburkholderia sp. HD33-4]|uniref:AraC family transcriptional regulator n=1 Tax=Paraburkholderia sp. HD33-4 TaxID=2883242 RepID=UPI001F27A311|nr:AraC family transcriptional regulator [Paraburkholderia sp. HD33-4]